MRSSIMTFTFGHVDVCMYKNDDGDYVVNRELTLVSDVSVTHVGTLREREDAARLFNKEVMRLTREWELTAS